MIDYINTVDLGDDFIPTATDSWYVVRWTFLGMQSGVMHGLAVLLSLFFTSTHPRFPLETSLNF